MNIDYPNLILTLRAKLDLSQDEFGKLLGVSLNSVSRWERGEFEPTKLIKVRLKELAAEYDVLLKEKNNSNVT